MGNWGWEDDARGRSRPPRDARRWEDERSGGRPSYRDDAGPRSGGRGWSVDERSSSGSRSGSYGQRGRGYAPGRDGYDDYGGRDRSGRGPRSSAREEVWAPPSRGRVRQPGEGGPSGSNSRGRAPAYADPRGRGMRGRPDPRDPRVMRRGLVPEEDEEDEGSGLTAGKAMLIVLLMFVLGAGGAYGYYRVSTPKVSSTSTPAPASSVTPSTTTTPGASPTATPHALAPGAAPGYAVYVVPAQVV